MFQIFFFFYSYKKSSLVIIYNKLSCMRNIATILMLWTSCIIFFMWMLCSCWSPQIFVFVFNGVHIVADKILLLVLEVHFWWTWIRTVFFQLLFVLPAVHVLLLFFRIMIDDVVLHLLRHVFLLEENAQWSKKWKSFRYLLWKHIKFLILIIHCFFLIAMT